MATGGSDLLEKVQDRLLECPICQEPYQVQGRTPRVLPCHHTLCTSCLDRLKASYPFRCPICRKSLSGHEFPTETTRMTLLDLVSTAKASPDATDRCWQHNKELEFCCYDCQTFLCSKCAMSFHRAHRVEDLEPLMQEKRKQVLEVGKWVEATLPKFHTRAGRSKAVVASLARGKDKAAARIRELFSEMATQVKARENQALEALQARFEADKRMVETENQGEQILLAEVQTLVQASQSLASQGTPTQLMSQVPRMEQFCLQLQGRALPNQHAAPVYQVESGGTRDLSRVLETLGNISALPRQPLAAPRQQMSNDIQGQKERIKKSLETPLREGDTWYLVDNGWFTQWRKYVGFDSWDTYSVGKMEAHPGCIDNSPLFKSDGSGHLHEELIEDVDYVLFPEEAWLDLESLHGLVDDRHQIARRVMKRDKYSKDCKVEVYPLQLKLFHYSDPYSSDLLRFSPDDTVEELEETMRDVFKVPPTIGVRLWKANMNGGFEQLEDLEQSLQDAGLHQGQAIVIQQRNFDGSWPM